MFFLLFNYVKSIFFKVDAHTLDQCAPPISGRPISNSLVQGIIGQEDRSFFEHRGVDWSELFQTVILNLSTFKKIRGGSTIDMQVYKLCYQTEYQRTIFEKIEQIIGAMAFNRNHSKNKILSTYLQKAPMGSVNGKKLVGFEMGAAMYFKKKIEELDYFEEWKLILTLKNRRRYNPRMVGDLKTLPPAIGRSLYKSALFQYHHQARLNTILKEIPFIFPRGPQFYVQWTKP